MSKNNLLFDTSDLPSGSSGIHLLDLEYMAPQSITNILDRAESIDFTNNEKATQKSQTPNHPLNGCQLVNLFFENSTRTRSSFEIAARNLGAQTLNFDVVTSSTSKGETLKDTLYTLYSMKPDIFVLRHGGSGAAHFVSRLLADLDEPVGLVNAGDGCHAHPTQALADLLTIRQNMVAKTMKAQKFSDLSVLIVGDIYHSRVARSLIQGLQKLGTKDIRTAGPPTLIQPLLPVEIYTDLKQAVRGVDVIVALRLQAERMELNRVPSTREYFRFWGISEEILELAAPGVLLMHPGPIMRGGDISSSAADGGHSVILQQVKNGVAVRKAVLERIYQNLIRLRND